MGSISMSVKWIKSLYNLSNRNQAIMVKRLSRKKAPLTPLALMTFLMDRPGRRPISFPAYSGPVAPSTPPFRYVKGLRFIDLTPERLLFTILSMINSHLSSKRHLRLSLLVADLVSIAKASRGFYSLAQYGFEYLSRLLPLVIPQSIVGLDWDVVIRYPAAIKKVLLKQALETVGIQPPSKGTFHRKHS